MAHKETPIWDRDWSKDKRKPKKFENDGDREKKKREEKSSRRRSKRRRDNYYYDDDDE